MLKGYVKAFKSRPGEDLRDYQFCFQLAEANPWKTREEAASFCVSMNREGVKIISADGGEHRCLGFNVEQRSPSEFVIFCMAPFIVGGGWVGETI